VDSSEPLDGAAARAAGALPPRHAVGRRVPVRATCDFRSDTPGGPSSCLRYPSCRPTVRDTTS